MTESQDSDAEYPALDSIRSRRIVRLSGPEGRKHYALMPPPALTERVARTSQIKQIEPTLFARARGSLATALDAVGLPVSLRERLAHAAELVLDWLSTNTIASDEIDVQVEHDDHDVYIRFDVPGGAGITAPHGIDLLQALGSTGSLSMNFEDGTLLTVLQHPILES